MKEKILLVLLILALCLSTCQTEYYPAAGYSSMYGGDVLYEWNVDALSIYTFKGIRQIGRAHV